MLETCFGYFVIKTARRDAAMDPVLLCKRSRPKDRDVAPNACLFCVFLFYFVVVLSGSRNNSRLLRTLVCIVSFCFILLWCSPGAGIIQGCSGIIQGCSARLFVLCPSVLFCCDALRESE